MRKYLIGTAISLVLLFAGSLFVSDLSVVVSANEAPNTWLDTTAPPRLEKSWDISDARFRTAIKQGYNPSCTYATAMTREYDRGIGLFRQTVTGCWYDSSIGRLLQNSNNLSVSDANPMAGPVTNIGKDGNNAFLIPTPRSEIFLEHSSYENSSRSYLKFFYKPKIESKYKMTKVSHTISAEDTLTLKTDYGKNLWPDKTSVNFSKTGRFFVGSADFGLFRVDLDTKKYLNFGVPIKRSSTWNPFMKVSITNDGRYAVAAGTAASGGQWMRVYDLDSCQDQQSDYLALTSANCAYRDLTDYLKQNIPGFNRFTMAEFLDENNILFYHYDNAKDKTYTRYILRAPGAEPRSRDYIALGDSFASGEGAYSYFKGTDEGRWLNNCHLSRKSYPYLLGSWLRLQDYHSVACSGTRFNNVIGPELIDESLSTPQRSNQYLKGPFDNDLNEWMPGFELQKSFLKVHSPDIATVSIIGNDLGFSDKIKRCLEPDTCYDTFEDRLELLREARSKFNTLVDVYEELRSASPATKIYAIGYPELGDPDGNCAVNVRLNKAELKFANDYVRHINEVIKSAAERAGVVYVDIRAALLGSRLCEGEGDKLAVNGLSAGNDVILVIGNESYHPNARGHELIGRTIIRPNRRFERANARPESRRETGYY